MKKFCDKMDYILKDAKMNDIQKLFEVSADNFLDEKKYPWVYDIAKLLYNHMQDSTTPTIFFSLREKVYRKKQLYIDKYSVETSAKYACLFPKRSIIDAGTIIFDDNGCSSVEVYTLEAYLRFRELIRYGIVDFMPICLIINCNSIRQVENTTQVFINSDPSFLQSNFNAAIKPVNHMLIKIPWLKNARIEDYIDLVKGNQLQFENYGLKVNEVIKLNNIELISETLIKELNEASIELSILLQTKQKELRTKGIVTTLGICCTIIPFLFPQISEIVEPKLLSSLLGVGTIKELFNMGNEITEINNIGKSDPYWIMWKWGKVY